ncbi:MAG: AtpZ/AtpI family protein [Pedobacter agri]|uniref:AtpZ/AtpI family protein n=1 Tax=Pedobacter agri TaxID=454586 RepID=A0A9X3IB67_9SPHI|nr:MULTISPECIES: AtpZ/AtpI family protein [Pedobacter]AZI25342.1 AtpZ/AtpI family protein [Pedobacter sp. G11]MCX3267085.1 AtpZ/AtpI family protein [Pedobacter agri]MDQ1141336.1 F0F1-type ATP synthase assembly protein I [Pedobacter agri]RYF24902.1 MAG: AtpZ/AtpI family protein [Flavobacteriales bacterium]
MENPKEDDTKKKVNAAAKYSAIGFQMIITIGLLTFIGYKIDEHRNSETKIITAAFALLGVGIALYQVIRQVTK